MRKLLQALLLLLVLPIVLSSCGGALAPTAAPPAPVSLAAVPGDGVVALSWVGNTSATSYRVKRSTTASGPYTQIATPTDTFYADTAAVNGITYYYVVVATNMLGDSANSAEVSATPAEPASVVTAPAITAQPQNASAATGQSATFTVVATGTPAPTFQWQASTDGTLWANLSTGTGPTSASYTTAATSPSDNAKQFRVVVTNSAGSATSNSVTLTVNSSASYTFPAPITRLTTRADILAQVSGTTYYLDATNGSDTSGNGSSALPWRTLGKVHTVLQSGDCVILRTGNYGAFNHKAARSAATVYIADAGHTPVLTNITLREDALPNHTPGDPETAWKTNLVFYGISIVPAYVNPGTTDPMDPNATSSTYAKSARAIDLKWFGNISFINCRLSPSDSYGVSKKFLSEAGIYLTDAPGIRIKGCDIDSFNSGIRYMQSPRVRIYHNKIHGVAGSMIVNGDALSPDAVIEGNHLYDSNWAVSDPYCPRRSVADHYHGSFIALFGGNTVVRNNIMHYGSNSSGMMLYDDTRIPFDNVLIEGNQIYDANNVYALRLYNVNSNVVIRNNTLVNKGRYGSTDDYKYNVALAVHSFLGSATGKRLLIHNNVIVGRVNLPPTLDEVDLAGNIVYATSLPIPATNTVAYPNSSYFETGFFAGELDVSWQNWENDGAGYANPHGHGKLLDLRLAPLSPAIGYGITTLQAPTRISSLTSEGFLTPSVIRTASEHSTGAMEQAP